MNSLGHGGGHGGHGHGHGHHHHGGGHHHGHHHGHGHHHHAYNLWYPGEYYYPNSYNIPTCPFIKAPVFASDGRVYENECYARAAGATVVRYLQPGDEVHRPGVSGSSLANTAEAPPKLSFSAKRRWLTIGSVLVGGFGLILGSVYIHSIRSKRRGHKHIDHATHASHPITNEGY